MAKAYEILPYSIDHLKTALLDASGIKQAIVEIKLHIIYFREYFSILSAKTMMVEHEYIDHDYLDDYAAFYVKCLTDYPRKCKRLHFFSAKFSQRQFQLLLSGAATRLTSAKLQETYLGFIVVKPLPQTIIGRTCLKLYPNDNGRRQFPCKREYKANLFGIPLAVESIAFQEQDQVVAACATSALWSVFQSTGHLFHHPIPSPVQITTAATSGVPYNTRTIPNKGLDPEQMASAVRHVGLEPNLIDVSHEEVFFSTLYAYLKGRIPVIVGVRLYDYIKNKEIGRHAVGVMGYSLGTPTPHQVGQYGFLTNASRIDRIYAHDDQIGPFARMMVDGVKVTATFQDGSSVNDHFSLATSFRSSSGNPAAVRALPEIALIPLYHKIRIPFGTIHDGIALFDFITRATNLPHTPLAWDIFLTTVEALKEDVLGNPGLAQQHKHKVLTTNMPRFLWMAQGWHNDAIVVSFLFDATEIEQASLIIRAIEPDQNFAQCIRVICDHSFVRQQLLPQLAGSASSQTAGFVLNIFDWYRANHFDN